MKRRLDAADVQKALAECASTDDLAKRLNISVSHAYYLLRNKNTQAVSVQSAAPAAAQTAAQTAAPDAVQVIRTKVDFTAFIPPVDTEYKMRDVDTAIEKYAARNDYATLLIGDAGSGKSYCAEQLAARQGKPFLRVMANEAALLQDLLGRRDINSQGATCFTFGLLLEFFQTPCVISIEEVNNTVPGKLFFLHEVLDNMKSGRRVFVREADTVVNIHPDCVIIMSCNPNNAKYSGTNKMNVALADRCVVVPFEAFTPHDVPKFFDCGAAETTAALKAYYTEARKLIAQSGMRVVFSLRSVKRIAKAIRAGDSIDQALAHNFYNMTLLTASEAEREQLESLARVCFGLQAMGSK